jgi:hypothetical protein
MIVTSPVLIFDILIFDFQKTHAKGRARCPATKL